MTSGLNRFKLEGLTIQQLVIMFEGRMPELFKKFYIHHVLGGHAA